MTQQIINIGAAPEDGTGDSLRTSFDKCNQNFTELYTSDAGKQPLDADLTAIAALTGTDTIYYRSGNVSWSPVTFSGLTFSGGVLTASASGAPINSPTFTGDPKAPTPATADNDTSIATTAFVKAQGYLVSSDLASYLTTGAAAATYQPLDADLTSLAAAAATNAIYYRSAANTWGPITVGAGLTFTGGTLASVAVSGQQVQTAYGENTAWTVWTAASMVGGSNTVPQQTDGKEIVTATITPKAIGNKLHFTITVPWSASANPNIWIALFKDAAAAAIAARGASCIGSESLMSATWEFETTAASTSATTFKVRFGTYSGISATLSINGTPGFAYLGGSQRVTLSITETVP